MKKCKRWFQRHEWKLIKKMNAVRGEGKDETDGTMRLERCNRCGAFRANFHCAWGVEPLDIYFVAYKFGIDIDKEMGNV